MIVCAMALVLWCDNPCVFMCMCDAITVFLKVEGLLLIV